MVETGDSGVRTVWGMETADLNLSYGTFFR